MFFIKVGSHVNLRFYSSDHSGERACMNVQGEQAILCVGALSLEPTPFFCPSPGCSFLLCPSFRWVHGAALFWFYKPLCLPTTLLLPPPHAPHQKSWYLKRNFLVSLCSGRPWNVVTEMFLICLPWIYLTLGIWSSLCASPSMFQVNQLEECLGGSVS